MKSKNLIYLGALIPLILISLSINPQEAFSESIEGAVVDANITDNIEQHHLPLDEHEEFLFENCQPSTGYQNGWKYDQAAKGADDFGFETNTIVTDFHSISYNSPTGPVNYEIRADNNSSPTGALLASGTGQNFETTFRGGNLHDIAFSLEEPFEAQGDTTYWFIINAPQSGNVGLDWCDAPGFGNNAWQFWSGYWQDRGNTQTAYFALSGEGGTVKKSGGGDNQWDTRPTFGVSHETRQGLIVENGFSFNGEYFTVTDNHHTDFAEQSVEIGTANSFTATVYADKQLKVQEFLFGIPNVGESHLAELGIEVWYDRDGIIEEIVVDQDTAVIDEGTISVSHQKTNCIAGETQPRCDTTTVSMTFLEPLIDKVMAIKAIDYANRDHKTYLNDGFDISGDSLNPMATQMIPANVKNQGLMEVTQLAKYSPYWQSADGRMFEMNSFGSFKEINQTFERFQDSGNAFTRVHSGFGGILDYEQNRATQVFDSTKLISELPDSFGHHFEIDNRINDQLIQDMIEQQEIAKKVLEEMDKQNRHY
jgi:hypothetical protein